MERAARSLQMDPTFGCLLNLCMIALQKINRIVFPFFRGLCKQLGKHGPAPAPYPHSRMENEAGIRGPARGLPGVCFALGVSRSGLELRGGFGVNAEFIDLSNLGK